MASERTRRREQAWSRVSMVVASISDCRNASLAGSRSVLCANTEHCRGMIICRLPYVTPHSRRPTLLCERGKSGISVNQYFPACQRKMQPCSTSLGDIMCSVLEESCRNLITSPPRRSYMYKVRVYASQMLVMTSSICTASPLIGFGPWQQKKSLDPHRILPLFPPPPNPSLPLLVMLISKKSPNGSRRLVPTPLPSVPRGVDVRPFERPALPLCRWCLG